MLSRFNDFVDRRHEYAREWKARTGGKVLGTFCTYVPEDIIYAAGNILPVRILGGLQPQDVSESHIAGLYCPFCRDCLSQGLLGKYDYLDGVMIAKSCMHMAQAFHSWSLHIPLSYSYFLGVPSLIGGRHATEYLADEMKDFKQSLEKWTGNTITDKDLDRGIETVNTTRRYLRQLYELRKSDPPLFSGAEATALVLSAQLIDKRELNPLLAQLQNDLPERKDGPKPGARIMVVGSENHDLELLRLIESRGANIVIEDQCTGSRYFWNEVVPQEDRLTAIAQRFIDRPRCPLKDVTERRRLDHVLNLAKEFNARGALLVNQKFCAPHEYDIPRINKMLQEKGFPTFLMELDTTIHRGAVATRTEAFVEMLEMDVA
ncbi:MAG: 2-hydroxyacyl-CoA dehydratase [Chloroflexi bacterium]|nr:2-hydroxyacyl-CoA dehydratase [Chloroflexota bacterium]